MRKALLVVCIALLFFSAHAQDRTKFLAAEFTYNTYDGTDVKHDFIRSSNYEDYYFDTDYYPSLQTRLERFTAAAKIELRSANEKFAFITGVRANHITAYTTSTSTNHTFYLLYREDETSTDYIRVDKITQSSLYLSVPLEIRISPYEKHPLNFFFSVGGEFGYRVSTSTEVKFRRSALNPYQKEIAGMFGSPQDFFASVYGRVGFSFGRKDPRLSIALDVPVFILTQTSTLVNPTLGVGGVLQYHFKL